MDKLRAAFAKARRRPVSEGMWKWLTDKGYVGEADEMPLERSEERL